MKSKPKSNQKQYRRRGQNTSIILLAGSRGREYDDIIAAAFAARSRFGSAANALATFARESPTFRVFAQLAAESGARK